MIVANGARSANPNLMHDLCSAAEFHASRACDNLEQARRLLEKLFEHLDEAKAQAHRAEQFMQRTWLNAYEPDDILMASALEERLRAQLQAASCLEPLDKAYLEVPF